MCPIAAGPERYRCRGTGHWDRSASLAGGRKRKGEVDYLIGRYRSYAHTGVNIYSFTNLDVPESKDLYKFVLE